MGQESSLVMAQDPHLPLSFILLTIKASTWPPLLEDLPLNLDLFSSSFFGWIMRLVLILNYWSLVCLFTLYKCYCCLYQFIWFASAVSEVQFICGIEIPICHYCLTGYKLDPNSYIFQLMWHLDLLVLR